MAFRPEFQEALALLAQGIGELISQGVDPPVLVGGAAVEIYTGGAVASGDFDFVTPHQQVLFNILENYGFVEGGPGFLKRSRLHPTLGFGVQVVSGQLMDGRADRGRLLVLRIEDKPVAIIPVEDLIADRLAQAYSVSPPRHDMLDQAKVLFQLASDLDEIYLEKRICEETGGDVTISALRSM